jgi:formamidase
MVRTVISVDPKKLPWEQATPLHNRRHPLLIPPVQENKVFCVNCVDWMGGQIKNNDSSDVVKTYLAQFGGTEQQVYLMM